MRPKIFWLTIALVAAVATARAETNAPAEAPSDPVALGKQLVEKKRCSICHAIDGKGGKTGKPMAEYAAKTDEQLKAALLDPKKSIGPDTKMPSYKDKFSDAEVNAVIAYIKTLKAK